MKSQKNILIAFLLNLSFSILEFIGGTLTNSVAIISDSIHDMGDTFSIGISYFLEKKSTKAPDDTYTYGYLRYSVIGSSITTLVLLISSIFVIINSVQRIANPVAINYNGMIIFAILGVVINLGATLFTKHGHSLNEKAVNLHMLEDVLGWIVVLVGAVVMKFTNFYLIDPILSILVALFIFVHAFKNFKIVLDLFLEKIPQNISIDDIKKALLEIDTINDVHHIHIWSIDGYSNYATMHVMVDDISNLEVKHMIRHTLLEHGISHVTIELETADENCEDCSCNVDISGVQEHHGHTHTHTHSHHHNKHHEHTHHNHAHHNHANNHNH